MEKKASAAVNDERTILRKFFEAIIVDGPTDNSVSETKLVRDTQSKLKVALRDQDKCTCAKRSWGGPCEVCQASDKELYTLRNFFNVLRRAKKTEMTPQEIQDFISNTKGWLSSAN